MTDEMAQQWMLSNMDTGNASLMRFLKYGIGDEAEWKGKTGEEALALFQTGRVDKDLMPQAYSMLALYTDSLTKGLGIEPSETAMMATNRGIVYSVKADRIPALAKAYGADASDIDVTLQWQIDGKGNPVPMYGIPAADEYGNPQLDDQGLQVWQYFYLSETKPNPQTENPIAKNEVSAVATQMIGTGGIGPTYQQLMTEEAKRRTDTENERIEYFTKPKVKVKQPAVEQPIIQQAAEKPDDDPIISTMNEGDRNVLYTTVKNLVAMKKTGMSINSFMLKDLKSRGIKQEHVDAMFEKILNEERK
jgi:hypothetical protein